MSIEIIDDRVNMDELLKEMDYLDRHSVMIGIFGDDGENGSFYAMLANVHEFGMTIFPKKGKYLAIPCHEKSVGKRPGDFPGLVPMFGRNHNIYGLGMPRQGKDPVKYFVLKDKVKIPERSFIRSTFDEKESAWYEFIEKQLEKVVDGEITGKQLLDRLGDRIAADIQMKIRNLHEPGNAPLTVQNKGFDNPLIQSGQLRQHVTWMIVKSRG